MRIYVAGKTHDYLKVRAVQARIRERGHTITYDWTVNVEHHGAEHELVDPTPEQQRKYAELDLRGVVSAHLVVALWHPRWLGTSMEIGMALGAHATTGKARAVWVVGQPDKPCVFWHLCEVVIMTPAEFDRALDLLS